MTTNPVEALAGSGAPGTFIPAVTPLVGLNYFDGRFLRAADLNQERRAQRAYAELANRAGGAGVVHGFDVSRRTPGRIGLSAGLAVDPQGRLMYLPDAVEADVAALLDGPAGTDSAAGSVAGFAPCTRAAQDAPAGGAVTVVNGVSLYLVCLSQAQQVCGETEVFGRLCADGCVTATDAPYVVDGVTLSLRSLQLGTPLPALAGVTTPETHLRSQVAAAYFADEWQLGGSLLSAAGLGLRPWCLGAPAAAVASPAGPDAVPIGVLGWDGAQIALLDSWIARRERMAAPPRSYWDGRLELRPWPVFLAQLLQFQCQVADLLDAGLALPGDTARALLGRSSRAVDEILGSFLTARASAALIAALAAAEAAAGPARILLDGGIVELPPAGYLPIDLSTGAAVRRQVADLLGPGVDLRLCAVGRDQIAHELERAAHLRRISLLRGLADPAAREPVDVLVPDGIVRTAAAGRGGVTLAVDVAAGPIRLPAPPRPRLIEAAARAENQLPLFGAARVEPGPAIDATGVAVGTAARGVKALVAKIAEAVAPGAGLAGLADELDGARFGTGTPSMRDIRAAAAAVLESAVAHRAQGSDRALALAGRTNPQVAATLATVWVAADPFTIEELSSVSFNATLELVLPGSQGAATFSARVDGSLMRDFDRARTTGDQILVKARAGLTATVTGVPRPGFPPSFEQTVVVRRLRLEGYEVLAVNDDDLKWVAAAAWKGTPVNAHAVLLDIARIDVATSDKVVTVLTAVLRDEPDPAGVKRIIDIDGTEDATIRQAENEHHAAAVAGLQILSGLHPKDAAFVERGVRKLFPARGDTTAEIRPVTDWVLFRRRRREECEGVVAAPPATTSKVTAWLVHAADPDGSAEMASLLRNGKGDDLPWTRADEVEFEPGTASLLSTSAVWRQRYRSAGGGDVIRFAGYGVTPGSGSDPLGFGRAKALVDATAGVAAPASAEVADLVANPPLSRLITGTDGSVFLVSHDAPTLCVDVFAVDTGIDEGAAVAEAVRTGNVGGVDGAQPLIVPSLGTSKRKDDLAPIAAKLSEVVKTMSARDGVPIGTMVAAPFGWVRASSDELLARVREVADGLGLLRLETQTVDLPDGCPARLYVVLFGTLPG